MCEAYSEARRTSMEPGSEARALGPMAPKMKRAGSVDPGQAVVILVCKLMVAQRAGGASVASLEVCVHVLAIGS